MFGLLKFRKRQIVSFFNEKKDINVIASKYKSEDRGGK